MAGLGKGPELGDIVIKIGSESEGHLAQNWPWIRTAGLGYSPVIQPQCVLCFKAIRLQCYHHFERFAQFQLEDKLYLNLIFIDKLLYKSNFAVCYTHLNKLIMRCHLNGLCSTIWKETFVIPKQKWFLWQHTAFVACFYYICTTVSFTFFVGEDVVLSQKYLGIPESLHW